jgi:hypothetical protein
MSIDKEIKMNVKHNLCFCIIALSLQLSVFPAMAITTDELADICEEMESAINDISLEYEWYIIPPQSIEETKAEEMLIAKDGLMKFKLSAAGLVSNLGPNDPNSAFPYRLLSEESTTLMDKHGNTWDNITRASYNGKIAKYLNIGGWPREVRDGGISRSKRFFLPTANQTPIGFSVFRLRKDIDKIPLFAWLKREGLVHLDNTIQKVNGFNTIHANFLQRQTKQVCRRVYFSVDHGYTPVKYDYVSRNEVSLTFEVCSLEEVAQGLWFPSSGVINRAGYKRVNAWQATSKILVNRGLTEKDFDVKFPPGTKVRDEIKDVEYTVRSE